MVGRLSMETKRLMVIQRLLAILQQTATIILVAIVMLPEIAISEGI